MFLLKNKKKILIYIHEGILKSCIYNVLFYFDVLCTCASGRPWVEDTDRCMLYTVRTAAYVDVRWDWIEMSGGILGLGPKTLYIFHPTGHRTLL